MNNTCDKHDKLSDDLAKIRESLARVETSLLQSVATKDFVIAEIGKVYNRVNAIIGGLAGLLVITGSAVAYLIK
jgi:hypothetical protein